MIFSLYNDRENRENEVIHIPIIKREKFNGKSNFNQDICPICLESYQLNEDISELKCQHIFHSNCINSWINMEKFNCPTCNSIIL